MKVKKLPPSFATFDFEPGSYMILENGPEDIFMVLPCGDNFRPDGRWEVKYPEDENKITLSPSIFCKGASQNPCWHGYLINGEFKSV